MPELSDSSYGEQVYSQVYKQGNKRYETHVYESENGSLTVIFRKYLRKSDEDGKRKMFVTQETLVKAKNRRALRFADYPDYPEAIKFLHSDYFKSLK